MLLRSEGAVKPLLRTRSLTTGLQPGAQQPKTGDAVPACPDTPDLSRYSGLVERVGMGTRCIRGSWPMHVLRGSIGYATRTAAFAISNTPTPTRTRPMTTIRVAKRTSRRSALLPRRNHPTRRCAETGPGMIIAPYSHYAPICAAIAQERGGKTCSGKPN